MSPSQSPFFQPCSNYDQIYRQWFSERELPKKGLELQQNSQKKRPCKQTSTQTVGRHQGSIGWSNEVKKCFWNYLKIIQGKGNEKVLKRSFQRSHSKYARKFSSLLIFFFSQLGSKEYSVHTRHSSLSFGQAAVSFCLPGATSCSSYKLMISLDADLPTPLQIGQVSLKLCLPSKKIYLSLTIGRTFFLALFTVLFFRPLVELGRWPSPRALSWTPLIQNQDSGISISVTDLESDTQNKRLYFQFSEEAEMSTTPLPSKNGKLWSFSFSGVFHVICHCAHGGKGITGFYLSQVLQSLQHFILIGRKVYDVIFFWFALEFSGDKFVQSIT